MFPVMKTMRLSDSNTPGMDKIYFFTKETSIRIAKMAPSLDKYFDKDIFTKYLDSNYDILDSDEIEEDLCFEEIAITENPFSPDIKRSKKKQKTHHCQFI